MRQAYQFSPKIQRFCFLVSPFTWILSIVYFTFYTLYFFDKDLEKHSISCIPQKSLQNQMQGIYMHYSLKNSLELERIPGSWTLRPAAPLKKMLRGVQNGNMQVFHDRERNLHSPTISWPL